MYRIGKWLGAALCPGMLISIAFILLPGFVAAEEVLESADNVLQQASMYERAGEVDYAVSLLRQYVLEQPDAEQVDVARAHLSRMLFEQDLHEQAQAYAERLPVNRRPVQLVINQARTRLVSGDVERAEAMLNQLDAAEMRSSQRSAYLQTQMEIALQRGRLMQVLVFCQQMLEYDDSDAGSVARAGAVALQALAQMDPAQLQEAEFMFGSTPVAGILGLYALQSLDADEHGQDSPAYKQALHLVRTAQSSWVRKQAAVYLDRFEGKTWRQHALGVVLPLSGRYAPFGRMVRHGIELAAAMYGEQAPELIFRDSRSDQEHTRRVMEDLVYTQRVMAVLGPLDADPARVAAEFAERAKVPILLLSHRSDLPQIGAFVFRHSLTARQQAQTIAAYAYNHLGLRTFAVLRPENNFGAELAQYFVQALAQTDAQVLYQRHYAPESTDFRAALDPMSPPQLEEETDPEALGAEDTGAEDVQPEVEFEALFIPDYAETVSLIAPQLAFMGIEKVQLLGINGWKSQTLLQRAGPYVRGAVICDGFDPESSSIFVQKFVSEYHRQYSEAPSILAAQAYDSANLLFQVLEDSHINDHEGLRQALHHVDYSMGVSGLRGFDADGEAVRDMVLFKFGKNGIYRIDSEVMALDPMLPRPQGAVE